MSYLRAKEQWDYKLFQDSGVVGDTEGGFSAGGRLKQINAKYTEKLIIYLALQEQGNMLGKQWNKRPSYILCYQPLVCFQLNYTVLKLVGK